MYRQVIAYSVGCHGNCVRQGRTHANCTTWITLRFGNKAATLRVFSLEEQFLGKTHGILRLSNGTEIRGTSQHTLADGNAGIVGVAQDINYVPEEVGQWRYFTQPDKLYVSIIANLSLNPEYQIFYLADL